MNQTEFTVSAPGKVILFGEHAVIYGKRAVAAAVDLRTSAHLLPTADGIIALILPDLNFEKTWTITDLTTISESIKSAAGDHPMGDEYFSRTNWTQKISGLENEDEVVQKAVLVFWYLLIRIFHSGRHLTSLKLTVKSEFPVCVGLGSSGAYCVCVAAALLQAAHIIPAPSTRLPDNDSFTWKDDHLTIIKSWAHSAESLIHNGSSGLDVTVSTFGGIASYQKGQPVSMLHNTSDVQVILVNSKVERGAGDMVQKVRRRLDEDPVGTNEIFDEIDDISSKAVEALKSRNDSHELLSDLCGKCNERLKQLGVGHAKSDQICDLLARFGIVAKITGAGGGGCVFGFIEPGSSSAVLADIEEELKKIECELWQPTLGGPGAIGRMGHLRSFDLINKC